MRETAHPEYVICPACGEQHGDAWEWCNSENPIPVICQECGEDFYCWAEFDVRYHASIESP